MIQKIKRITIDNKLKTFLNSCKSINNFEDGEPSVILSNGDIILSFWRLGVDNDYKFIEVYKNKIKKYSGLEIDDDIILEVVGDLYKNYKITLND